MASGGFKPGSSVADQMEALSVRDRIVAAVLVAVVLAAQTWWMGRGVSLLSAGLFITYGLWSTAGWKNDAARILPVYLLAVAVQCLHFTEEYMTGFQHQFPRLIGAGQWSDARFVAFNMLWLAIFVLAGAGVYRRLPMAYLAVIFLALIGGVGNGASHLLLSAMYGRYFPGLVTAPLCLLAGIAVLVKLFAKATGRV